MNNKTPKQNKKKGGTWCGICTEKGFFSLLTNVRPKSISKEKSKLESRGLLVENLLKGKLEDLKEEESKKYSPFNLFHSNLFKFPCKMEFVSNSHHHPNLLSEKLINQKYQLLESGKKKKKKRKKKKKS